MMSKTKSTILLVLALLGALAALPAQAQPVCIRFEPPDFPLGTVYGRPAGDVSGDLVFSFNLIDAYVYDFNLFVGTTFNYAFITNAPIAFSPGQSLRVNNINLLFDFRNVGFNVRRVTFSYLDLGGHENLGVNGAVYVGELKAAPPVIGGANVAVTSTPLPPPASGRFGSVVIQAPTINEVMIGGQELWIDSVCAQ
jgi:hypothetical protein